MKMTGIVMVVSLTNDKLDIQNTKSKNIIHDGSGQWNHGYSKLQVKTICMQIVVEDQF